MIGKSMETWPTQALQNVADARAMCAGDWGDPSGVGCLLTTAFGGSHGEVADKALGMDAVNAIVGRFDRLHCGERWNFRLGRFITVGKAFDAEALRVMCQNRARRILAARTLARLASTDSAVPESAVF